MKNRTPLAAALLAGVLAVTGCSSNSQGDDASPVFLSVNYTLLPESWNVGSGAPLQFDTTELRSILKNPGAGSSSFLDTRLDDYVVEWKRIDGGTKVPDPETFARERPDPGRRELHPLELPLHVPDGPPPCRRSISSSRSTAGSTGRPAGARSAARRR